MPAYYGTITAEYRIGSPLELEEQQIESLVLRSLDLYREEVVSQSTKKVSVAKITLECPEVVQ